MKNDTKKNTPNKKSATKSAVDERLDQRFEWAKSEMRSPFDLTKDRESYSHLDEYVREPVYLLQKHGVLTQQSCHGGPGHSYDEPTIDFAGGPGDGFLALQVLITYGYAVNELLRVYDVDLAEITGTYWRITFQARMPSNRLRSGFDLRMGLNA